MTHNVIADQEAGKRVLSALGFAGVLPFAISVAALWLTRGYAQALAQHAFVMYSLVILSFLAGSLWGNVLAELRSQPASWGRPALLRALISNGVALFAVGAVLTSQTFVAAMLLSIGYLAFLWYERAAVNWMSWYLRLRWRLTVTVVALHGVYLAGLASTQS
jgi:hypothetical protein